MGLFWHWAVLDSGRIMQEVHFLCFYMAILGLCAAASLFISLWNFTSSIFVVRSLSIHCFCWGEKHGHILTIIWLTWLHFSGFNWVLDLTALFIPCYIYIILPKSFFNVVTLELAIYICSYSWLLLRNSPPVQRYCKFLMEFSIGFSLSL